MTVLHHEVDIAASPEQVWAVLADLPGVRHYNPTVLDSRLISALTEGVGAMRECDLKPKGLIKERVFLWEPKTTIGLEVAESDYPLIYMRWRTHLAAHNGGTRMSQDTEYKVKFGPLGQLMDLLMMRRMLNKTLTEIFAGLKQYIETQTESDNKDNINHRLEMVV